MMLVLCYMYIIRITRPSEVNIVMCWEPKLLIALIIWQVISTAHKGCPNLSKNDFCVQVNRWTIEELC